MIEAALVAGIVLALFIVTHGGTLVQWHLLLGTGAAAVALCLAAGVVAGLLYHLLLYRALSPLGLLRKGWIWHPTLYHSRLPAHRRRGVMFWFYCGVSFMFATLGGCLLVLAGLVAARSSL